MSHCKTFVMRMQALESNTHAQLAYAAMCRVRNVPRRPHTWRIRSACLKLHPRRVTALEFPPGSLNLVCSADKKGLIGVWDFDEVLFATASANSAALPCQQHCLVVHLHMQRFDMYVQLRCCGVLRLCTAMTLCTAVTRCAIAGDRAHGV